MVHKGSIPESEKEYSSKQDLWEAIQTFASNFKIEKLRSMNKRLMKVTEYKGVHNI